jgi:hypothetical protein
MVSQLAKGMPRFPVVVVRNLAGVIEDHRWYLGFLHDLGRWLRRENDLNLANYHLWAHRLCMEAA